MQEMIMRRGRPGNHWTPERCGILCGLVECWLWAAARLLTKLRLIRTVGTKKSSRDGYKYSTKLSKRCKFESNAAREAFSSKDDAYTVYPSQRRFSFASVTLKSQTPLLFQQMKDMSSASKSWTTRHTLHYIQVNLLYYFNAHVLLFSRHDIKSLTYSRCTPFREDERCKEKSKKMLLGLPCAVGTMWCWPETIHVRRDFHFPGFSANGLKPTTSSSMQTCLAIFGISRDSTCCEKNIDVKQFLLVQLYFFTHPTHSSTLFAQRPRISAVQDDAEQMVVELRQEPSSFGLWGKTLLRSLESLRILVNPWVPLATLMAEQWRMCSAWFALDLCPLVPFGYRRYSLLWHVLNS